MAKGKASAFALKSIIHQVRQSLTGWAGTAQGKRYGFGVGSELPPLYQVAALRGEAILLQRFFGEIRAQTALTVDDSVWLNFWHDTVQDGGFLIDFISRVGWLALLSKSTDLPSLNAATAKLYYCLLLDQLQTHQPELVAVALDDYMLHLWRQRFPSVAAAQSALLTPSEQLKQQLKLKLRQQHHQTVELKESFVQQETQVRFSLRYRLATNLPWHTLIELERPRLKSARLAAYEQALKHDTTAI